MLMVLIFMGSNMLYITWQVNNEPVFRRLQGPIHFPARILTKAQYISGLTNRIKEMKRRRMFIGKHFVGVLPTQEYINSLEADLSTNLG